MGASTNNSHSRRVLHMILLMTNRIKKGTFLKTRGGTAQTRSRRKGANEIEGSISSGQYKARLCADALKESNCTNLSTANGQFNPITAYITFKLIVNIKRRCAHRGLCLAVWSYSHIKLNDGIKNLVTYSLAS